MRDTLFHSLCELADTPPAKSGLLEAALVTPEPSDTVDTHLNNAVHHAATAAKHHEEGDGDAAAHHARIAKAHVRAANTKQRAENHPQNHRGEKMVFGVWRTVGKELKPAAHKNLADEYKTHADRLKKRANVRALLIHHQHVDKLPDDHKERVLSRSVAASKRAEDHAKGVDPMGSSTRGVTRDGGAPRPLMLLPKAGVAPSHAHWEGPPDTAKIDHDLGLDDLDDFEPESLKASAKRKPRASKPRPQGPSLPKGGKPNPFRK